MSNTNPARGMRDFLPEQVRKRNYVIGVIKEVYEKYGFEPLETPTIENLSTLTNKYGEEGDQLMFKILKRGEKLASKLEAGEIKNENELTDLALRYDLTVPLARVVANYKNELPKFFKRYQIQPVWRADRPARGRYREFYQCDVDAIGSKSMIVEAELCSAVSEILERLGFDDFVIKVNHRELLFSFLNYLEIPAEKNIDVLTAIDKLGKLPLEKISDELGEKGIGKDSLEKLINYIRKFESAWKEGTGVNESSLSEFPGDQIVKAKLNELFIFAHLPRLKFYPFLARGLSYYTGAIFEIELTNGDFSGSIAGGGRYDGLIGMFGKEEIPAVGLSLGLERILMIMEERRMFPEDLQTNAADVLVTLMNEESAAESLKLAGELRKSGLRTFVYPEADKLGKQFKYADQINVEYVCVLGETEIAENTVTLKNMKTGEQETLAVDEAIQKIRAV
ncbi:MAG: histidine--tRNA ligase [Acidobacteria bacterium]|nr:histidine--tRNA ligase [Acidobacteriota bacterium]